MRKRYYVLFFAMMAVYLSCTTTTPVQPTVDSTVEKTTTSSTLTLVRTLTTAQLTTKSITTDTAIAQLQRKYKADSVTNLKNMAAQAKSNSDFLSANLATSKLLNLTRDSLTALKTSVTGLIKTVDMTIFAIDKNGTLTIPLIPVLQQDMIKVKALIPIK